MPSQGTVTGIVGFAGRLKGIDVRVLGEGLEIARLLRRLEPVMENELAAWGLTARQVEIMESLYHDAEGTLTPADLSEEVGLTRSAMTSAPDALEKMGHTVWSPPLEGPKDAGDLPRRFGARVHRSAIAGAVPEALPGHERPLGK